MSFVPISADAPFLLVNIRYRTLNQRRSLMLVFSKTVPTVSEKR